MSIRPVKRLIKSKPTMEGAGVHLRRAFGFRQHLRLRPLPPARRFPQRRSRGLPGRLPLASPSRHRDHHLCPRRHGRARRQHGQPRRHRSRRHSMDDRRLAASSTRKCPKATRSGRMHGFQLWANLPSSLKMTAPRYQEVKSAEIPELTDDDGTQARIVCGTFLGKNRPRRRHRRRPDLSRCLRPARQTKNASRRDHAPRLRLRLRRRSENSATPPAPSPCRPKASAGWTQRLPPTPTTARLILFDRGDEVTVQAGEDGIRFLLVSGKPLEEPVAWYGPIVMNTQEQLRQAFEELEKGTFLKK